MKRLSIVLALMMAGSPSGCRDDGNEGGSESPSDSGGTPSVGSVTFTLVNSVTVSTGLWGGIGYDGTSLSITNEQNSNIYVRKYDLNLQPAGSTTQLTIGSDPGAGSIADHKHLFTGGSHYICYSASSTDSLYVMRYDTNWQRQGSIVTVVSGTTDTRTNDMYMVTDGSLIWIGRFRPPNPQSTPPQSSGHQMSRHTLSLAVAGSEVVATDPSHTNGAGGLWDGSQFVTFASAEAGTGQPHDIYRIHYDSRFNKISSATLVATSVNEFFPTGAAYDPVNQRYYIAYCTSSSGSGLNGIESAQGIILKAFSSSWQELGSVTIAQTGAVRAHLTLVGFDLYCAYDAGGVYLRKYSIGG